MAFLLRASPKQDCVGIPTSPQWLKHLPASWRCLWEGGPTERSLETHSETVASHLTPWVLQERVVIKKSKPGTSHYELTVTLHSALRVFLPSSTVISEPLLLAGGQLCVPVAVTLCHEGTQPRGAPHRRVCARLQLRNLPGYVLNNLLLHEEVFQQWHRLTNSTISSSASFPLSNLQRSPTPLLTLSF